MKKRTHIYEKTVIGLFFISLATLTVVFLSIIFIRRIDFHEERSIKVKTCYMTKIHETKLTLPYEKRSQNNTLHISKVDSIANRETYVLSLDSCSDYSSSGCIFNVINDNTIYISKYFDEDTISIPADDLSQYCRMLEINEIIRQHISTDTSPFNKLRMKTKYLIAPFVNCYFDYEFDILIINLIITILSGILFVIIWIRSIV